MEYIKARSASKALFDNALVLPVGLAILRTVEEGKTFEIGDVREALGGRVADASIRNALKRLVSLGAAPQLVSLGAPHADVWERHPHPFWPFADEWAGHLTEGASQPKKTG